MAVPNIDDLFAPIITCLSDGKIHSLKELTEYCAVALNLSKNDIEQRLDDGRTKLYFRVGWAKQHLKKAGLIDSPQRAYFRLTTEGFNVFKSGTEKINKKYLSQFDGYYYDKSTATNDNSDMINSIIESPQEKIKSALDELNIELIDELMNEIMKISPYDFERLVVKLLIAMGYGTLEENKDAVTPKSGDEGIDGIVSADKFGFDSIYIQAKQWKKDNLVSRPEIQKFIGALATTQGATKGIFITTSDFTKGAVEIISKQTQNKIVLVNGKQLAKLMIEYDLGVSTVATYKVKRIDSDFFNEDI